MKVTELRCVTYCLLFHRRIQLP